MTDFVNPADHCRAIGAKTGELLKNSERDDMKIVFFGHDYVVFELEDGSPMTMHSHEDITEWVKAEYVPVVTIRNLCGDGGNVFRVIVEGELTIEIDVEVLGRRFSGSDAAGYALIGAEAIKAEILNPVPY